VVKVCREKPEGAKTQEGIEACDEQTLDTDTTDRQLDKTLKARHRTAMFNDRRVRTGESLFG
jgi:hypothetical protein